MHLFNFHTCDFGHMSDGGLRNISLSSLLACRNAEVKSRLFTRHFITKAVNITILIASWLHAGESVFRLYESSSYLCNKACLHYLPFIFEFLHYNSSCWYTFLTNVKHTFIYSMNFHIFYFSFHCINPLFYLFLFRCEQKYIFLITYFLCYLWSFSPLINMIPIDTDWIFIFLF